LKLEAFIGLGDNGVVKQRRILVIASAVVVAGATAMFWPREREPVYIGKKLRDWLGDYERSFLHSAAVGAQERAAADEAIRRIGTNAVPWLVLWVEYERPTRSRARAFLEKIPIRAACTYLEKADSWDMVARARGVKGFRVLGAAASGAAPELARFARQPSTNGNACSAIQALACLGPEGFAHVTNCLKHPTAATRHCAVDSLRYLGPKSCEALGPLTNLLYTEADLSVRDAVWRALKEIAPETARGLLHEE
jgi:hypothetical protein